MKGRKSTKACVRTSLCTHFDIYEALVTQAHDFKVMCFECGIYFMKIRSSFWKKQVEALETRFLVHDQSKKSKRTGILCQELDTVQRGLSRILKLAKFLFLLVFRLVGRHGGRNRRNKERTKKLAKSRAFALGRPKISRKLSWLR